MNTTTENINQHDQPEKVEDGNGDNKLSHWIRLAYMIFFFIVLELAKTVVLLLAVASFLAIILKGNALEQAVKFGATLATYLKEVILFLTFNEEQAPWPFSKWPD